MNSNGQDHFAALGMGAASLTGAFGNDDNWGMDPSAAINTPSQIPNGASAESDADSAKNRGNYRCSKCGEPKKGHVCTYQPMNFKCKRCGNPKKSCICDAPDMLSTGIQCEMDDDMVVRSLDLAKQGVSEFHPAVHSIIPPQPHFQINGAS